MRAKSDSGLLNTLKAEKLALEDDLRKNIAAKEEWAVKYDQLSQKAESSMLRLSEEGAAKGEMITSLESKIRKLETELRRASNSFVGTGELQEKIKDLESDLRKKEYEYEQVNSDLELRAEEYMDELARLKEECDQLTSATTQQEYDARKNMELIRSLKSEIEEANRERDAALREVATVSRDYTEKVFSFS